MKHPNSTEEGTMLTNIALRKYPLLLVPLGLIILSFVIFAPAGRPAQASVPAVAQALTLDDRLACRTAIEQVYWQATDWPAANPQPKPALDAVLSQAQIESQVRDTLAQSVALQEQWGLAVTAEMLQAELDRMAAYSQSPDRLADLFSALGNDPAAIAECLVRPALVDRLIRQQYGLDSSIHTATRAAAESALDGLATAAHLATLPNAETVSWTLTEELLAESQPVPAGTVALEQGAFNARLDEARQAFNLAPDAALPLNLASPLNENAGRFYALAITESTAEHLTIVYAIWNKQPFESWWLANAAAFSSDAFSQPAFDYRLPALAARGSQGPETTDAWQYMPAMPWATISSRSVWTGSVMLVWGGAYTTNGFRYDPVLDDWRPITTLNAPHGRHSFTAVWTGTEMIVFGGCNGGTEFCTDGSGGRYDPLTDTWAPITPGFVRRQHVAVWSGSEMLVWGGCREDANGNQNCNLLVEQGARYNPATDSWTNMTLTGAPTGTRNPKAVWAGDQMIIWNGTGSSNGRYFPATDSWQPISTSNAPPARLPALVWTGSQMIAWGGCSGDVTCPTMHDEGGRYNPTTDSWLPTTLTNAPSGRVNHSAVWTGDQMIVWGGSNGPGSFLSDGRRYDPATDAWTAVSGSGAPTARGLHHAYWTGQVMIIWGGDGSADERSGGRYNPATDSWTPTTTNDPYRNANVHSSIWDGTQMISWGGEGEEFIDPFYQRARLYDPALDLWGMSSQNPDLDYWWWPTAVWTGSEMIIWGGQYGSAITDDGARYNPMTDSWIQTSQTNVPEARAHHSGVWTGSELIVWGGSTWSEPSVSTGGRYDPATDTWTATTLTGAAGARNLHEAVWTGDRMIVWGGRDDILFPTNTGGVYDPATDSWANMTTASAPDGRVFYAHGWTGSEFLVWGGGAYVSNWTYYQDGGLYDPVTNSWTPTNLTGAPEGRARLDSVWNGEELIVWGGCNNHDCSQDVHTGGRYNPTTAVWTPTTTDHVIEARQFHTMVWTGSEVLVWGGQTDRNGYTHIGGRYQFPFSGNAAPQANADAYSLQANTTLTVTAPGVLANDFDVDGDPLTATLVTTPTIGVLDFNADGSFVYTPDPGFSGTVTFHYRASDGQAQSNTAPVVLTVHPEPNQAPVAAGDAYTTTEGIALVVPAPGVLANDSDPDGDPLQAVLVAAPANGQLSLDADGSFTYTPDAGFSGQDTFTYQAFDGQDYSAVTTVTITVEPAAPSADYIIYLPMVLEP
jgi:N-acetylneuraminic acid mutarotase